MDEPTREPLIERLKHQKAPPSVTPILDECRLALEEIARIAGGIDHAGAENIGYIARHGVPPEGS